MIHDSAREHIRAAVMLVIVILGTLVGAGCLEGPASPDGRTTTVTDMLGREVEVPVNVERVVGIEAGALRLLVYLECTDEVVGVEDIEQKGGKPYNFAHPGLAELPSIGPIHGGDAEMIVGQEPDVIFWTYTTEGDADDLQRKTGVPVVALVYGDLGDQRSTFYEALDLMASVMDKEDRAMEIQKYIDEVIGDLDTRTSDLPEGERKAAYVGGIGYRGAHGLLSTEPGYEPLAFVNGLNAAADLGMEHAFVDKEKILEWDPAIIFADQGGMALVKEDLKDPAYENVEAVKNGDIFGVMPYNYYTTNMGTVLADAYYIGSILYPDAFSDIDPETKADEIYVELVGKAVYGDMESTYGGFERIPVGE